MLSFYLSPGEDREHTVPFAIYHLLLFICSNSREWLFHSKFLLKKKFKYCNEFGKARFDSSQYSSLFILAANHNLWRMWNYFYRYWHEIAISRKLLHFHRVHSKVHAKIVLMSVKFGNNFTLFYHCRAKTYQIDVLIYLSRRKTGPSLNSAILLLIEFPIVLYKFKLKCLQLLVTIQILASVWQSLNFNPAVLFSFQVSLLRHSPRF